MLSKYQFCIMLLLPGLLWAAGERFTLNPVSPRSIRVGQENRLSLCHQGQPTVEVVYPGKASPVAKYAAEEVALRLSQAFNCDIKPVTVASGSVPAIILGDQELAAKHGLDLNALDRDGYYIKTFPNYCLIIGRDDPNGRPGKRTGYYERATLFGAYEFLERFLGVRYYFPGEIGTVVPEYQNFALPDIDLTDRPDNQYRSIYTKQLGKGKYLYPGLEPADISRESNLQLRQNTRRIPNCHGINGLQLPQRFAKEHPEYFALRANGTREDGTGGVRSDSVYGHVCFSAPGLKNEIYLDAEALLLGKSHKDRGLPRSWANHHEAPFFNLMPNDAMARCQCDGCRPYFQAKDPQQTSDFIWSWYCDIAKRLKDNNIPGYVTTMAYDVYRPIPTLDLPDNIIVMLAQSGPWREFGPNKDKDDALVAAWKNKLGAKLYLWTYPTKIGSMLPGIPNVAPRATASYFKRQTPHIFGAFYEAETDVWLFGHLNYYVFSKLMWDNDTDVNALLQEYCHLMYGPAEQEMLEFFDSLEKHWIQDVLTNFYDTPEGPKTALPSLHEVWTKIFSPAECARLTALLDQAEQKTAAVPKAAARVKFMRTELWQHIEDGFAHYQKTISDISAWKTVMPETKTEIIPDGKLDEADWQDAPWIGLIPRVVNTVKEDEPAEVHTRIKMLHDQQFFYFAFICEEPNTEAMAEVQRQFDEIELWKDNVVEIFLAADHQSRIVYQFMIGSSGCRTDLRKSPGHLGKEWNSGFEAGITKEPGKQWIAEIRIPRQSMPEIQGQQMVANFSRSRVLTDDSKFNVPYYVWTQFVKQDAESCGVVHFQEPLPKSEIKNGDFAAPVTGKRFLGAWAANTAIQQDHGIYRTRNASVRLSGDARSIVQRVPQLQPGKQYKLSFYVRLDGVEITDKDNSGFFIRFDMGNGKPQYPIRPALRGTIPWLRQEANISIPDDFGAKSVPYIEFKCPNSTGTAWIDQVELVLIEAK